jgi:formylglycine-generating enzyme required for sulfatase activity
MSRIFLSHSSENNAQALALCDWLKNGGWDDVFVDLDPKRGIRPGERWEQALRSAAFRCEAVLFLVSRAWLDSEWCRDEFKLARHLEKRLFGLLIEDIPDLPPDITREWQHVNVVAGDPKTTFSVTLPQRSETVDVAFSVEGLRRLELGLQAAGLEARFFPWPPDKEPDRPPYRGLSPFEAEDAGIFFGRDADIMEAIDDLRRLRNMAPPRLYFVLGGSGSGKSSFVRAGLLPRLARDDRNFLPLPILRPARAAISGETGLVSAIAKAMEARAIPYTLPDIREAIAGGAQTLRPLLMKLVESVQHSTLSDEATTKAPLIVISVDQGEELNPLDGGEEAEQLLALLRELASKDSPAVLVLITIRTELYERLQGSEILEGIRQETLSLSSMPRGAYQAVIEGPVERLRDGPRALAIDPALTKALLVDIDSGGGRDALALLSFTLERLYREFKGRGRQLRLDDYQKLGGIKGSIDAAVERALEAADKDPRIPRDRNVRLLLLRRGLIPWLAGIDENGKPRRYVARLSEIPQEARPLIDRLVEMRLLATGVNKESGEFTIEPVHETLLRQWGLLQGWLEEDVGPLGVLEGIKRAARDWAANNRDPDWLTHRAGRLRAAERLRQRTDLAAKLEPTDWDYLAQCRRRERATSGEKRRAMAVIGVLCVIALIGLAYAGWSNRAYLKVRAEVLVERAQKLVKGDVEPTANAREPFQDCVHCPRMMVVPAGTFVMGGLKAEGKSLDNARPLHPVSIAYPFAVSKFEITFDQWEACYQLGGCGKPEDHPGGEWPPDYGWGRGNRPVVGITWDDAKRYVIWLAERTGKPYRLLTEAEWEYAARGGTQTTYFWGDEIDKDEKNSARASCDGCGSASNNDRTEPIGSFTANAYGLHDMHGNVWEWVEDCYHENYEGAPTDGSAGGNECREHVLRGGSWFNAPAFIRSASRYWRDPANNDVRNDLPSTRWHSIGLRVARDLPGNR